MLILNNTPVHIEKANYVMIAVGSAGTVTLSMSVDGLPAVEIPTASWSSNTAVEISLPNCILSAVITGDMQVAIRDTGSTLR